MKCIDSIILGFETHRQCTNWKYEMDCTDKQEYKICIDSVKDINMNCIENM